jgi:hypothetical protein
VPPGTTLRFPLQSPIDDGVAGLNTETTDVDLIAPVLICAAIPPGSCSPPLPVDPPLPDPLPLPLPPLDPPLPEPPLPDPVVVAIESDPDVPLCVVALIVARPVRCATITAASPALPPQFVEAMLSTVGSELLHVM